MLAAVAFIGTFVVFIGLALSAFVMYAVDTGGLRAHDRQG
jgi:hypothetical protein